MTCQAALAYAAHRCIISKLCCIIGFVSTRLHHRPGSAHRALQVFVLLRAMMLWLCKTEPHVTVLLHVICLMWKVHFTLTCQIKVIRNLLSAMQDVYTDSGIGLTRGNAFPASEVTKVSQDSRHLWLQQRPFRLKRSMSTSLAHMGQVCRIVCVALLRMA